jgi:nucleoside-diphosphate-sugar epimerase
MHSVFIIGCGDIGRRIARRLPGLKVTGLVSGQSSAALLKSLGIMPVIANLDIPGELDDLDIEGQVVFYLAPPPGEGQKDTRMRHFLEAIGDQRPEKLVYISTSGVYGDCQGAWVTEEWPARPYAARAIRRWDAEQQLMSWSARSGVPVVRLRVGGIYAPDRLPIARIKKGLTVICPDEAPWSNRIHADDLARVCIAAAERGEAGEIFNAADGHPTSMTDYFYQVADCLGLPRPDCVSLAEAEKNLTPAMLSFVRESRRLDISRMKERLKIQLDYPILSEGLVSDVACT